MSYAYLFKYIIIGDTGAWNGIAKHYVFLPVAASLNSLFSRRWKILFTSAIY
jgi:hypothetical protein